MCIIIVAIKCWIWDFAGGKAFWAPSLGSNLLTKAGRHLAPLASQRDLPLPIGISWPLLKQMESSQPEKHVLEETEDEGSAKRMRSDLGDAPATAAAAAETGAEATATAASSANSADTVSFAATEVRRHTMNSLRTAFPPDSPSFNLPRLSSSRATPHFTCSG
jgi:hypothetical protein